MSLAYIRACQNGCTYCKKTGHNKPNCPVAFQKCEEIRNAIDLIINSRRMEELKLSILFNDEKLTDLCFLMNNDRGFKQFIKKLVENGSITEEESRMRLKRHRVKVLMLRYWYSTVRYTELQTILANKITVKTPETVGDLSEFDCPICVSNLPAKEKVETGCKHCVCKGCFVSCLEHKILNMNYLPPKCWMCRTNITQVTIFNTDYVDEITELTNVM